ncbi:hypothetical protein ACJ73_10177 [Blastomyces percursus]|uniref:Uncharacterized protein n=1 Tax=Blastomyces percursus TaxID=1658174 RepID=A0A1J9NZT9_9EURO|nr:hypothetical protein ACJ73_10177 [Blastomyces percursus]
MNSCYSSVPKDRVEPSSQNCPRHPRPSIPRLWATILIDAKKAISDLERSHRLDISHTSSSFSPFSLVDDPRNYPALSGVMAATTIASDIRSLNLKCNMVLPLDPFWGVSNPIGEILRAVMLLFLILSWEPATPQVPFHVEHPGFRKAKP